VQELFDRAVRQADLQQLSEEILRDFLKYGDGFAEPLFAGPELVGVQTYRPAEMTVTRDDKGLLPRVRTTTASQSRSSSESVAQSRPAGNLGR